MQQTQIPWWKKMSMPFLAHRGEFRRDPQLSWKIIIALFFLGILAALGVGYFTYYSAIRAEDPGAPATVPRSALRGGDVKIVLDTYEQRKERFTSLLADQPEFLSPGKGSAISVKEEAPASSAEATTSPAMLP
jgi:hypothetical protein